RQMCIRDRDVASAIVDQHPEMFKSKMPNEMPKTGMGGTAALNYKNIPSQDNQYIILYSGILI
ncbi:hypothetical protein ACQ4LK_20875, partial [Bacillus pumilus]